jgi:2-polyprenyl-6-methoxyphenol hydroxylase-like FAD-dependent oxidoreductase
MMEAEVTDIVHDGGRVAGVVVATKEGQRTVQATLTIGADGRSSLVRERAGLHATSFGAPFDVFWMKLPRTTSESAPPLGRIRNGQIFVTINRGDYWQCGYVIPKGSADDVRSKGIDVLRERIATVAPEMAGSAGALQSWDDVRLLTVKVDRLKTWHTPGLLMIGDAAHAMSPIGGVGINLAVQDAVAAANLLAAPLRRGAVSVDDLRRVQQRREWPTRATQFMQITLQNQILARALGRPSTRVPLAMKLLNRFPLLQRIPARLVGLGFRPEHIVGGKF